MDQYGKIRYHQKKLLKISKIAKFESDTSLASEAEPRKVAKSY